MNDDKVYKPEEIQDQPFPLEDESAITPQANPTDSNVVKPQTIKDNNLPKRIISHETIAQSFNTKTQKILAEYQFTEMGAIQIGKYQNGVNGDIRISPGGIVARDSAGESTFALDSETGNVSIKGEIRSGSSVTGRVVIEEGGFLQIGNDQGDTIIDEFGLVSSTNFPNNNSVNVFLNQLFTADADVTGSSITFTLPRAAYMLFLPYASVRVENSTGNTMDFQIALYLDGSSKESIDFISVDLGDNRLQGSTVPYIEYVSSGNHTVKLKGIVTNKLGSPQALLYRFRLTYLILGR